LLFKQRFFSSGRPIRRHFKSFVWLGVKEHMDTILANFIWLIGNGECINLWLENWFGTPLVFLISILPSIVVCTTSYLFYIADGKWKVPASFLVNPLVAASIDHITLPVIPLPAQCVWPCSPDHEYLHHHPITLHHHITLHSFIYWRLMHHKLPTDDNSRSHGCMFVSICMLCYNTDETSSHLYLSCNFAMNL
jgi:hypothetical protein